MTATDAPAFKERSTSLLPLILKIVFLGAVLATACWLVPVLIGLKLWMARDHHRRHDRDFLHLLD